jgi:hypothetical protein
MHNLSFRAGALDGGRLCMRHVHNLSPRRSDARNDRFCRSTRPSAVVDQADQRAEQTPGALGHAGQGEQPVGGLGAGAQPL